MTTKYTVTLTKRAARQFHSLDRKTQVRLRSRIDNLALEPRPPGARKLSASEDIYRVRVGNWRILYQIHDEKLIVLVIEVGHRREVYRAL